MVAERVNSSQKLLDVGEKGVCSSYTLREEVLDTAPGVTFGEVSGFMASAAIGAGLGWRIGAKVSRSADLGGPA